MKTKIMIASGIVGVSVILLLFVALVTGNIKLPEFKLYKDEQLEEVEYSWNVSYNVQVVLATLIGDSDIEYDEDNTRKISDEEYKIVMEVVSKYAHDVDIEYFKFDIATGCYVFDNGKEYFVLDVSEGSAYYYTYK